MGSLASPSAEVTGILGIEEEINRRLAYEDLLWMVFRQLWTCHWELNIDLVCWLDDCRTPSELECVLEMGRSFWSTMSHLRKLAVDDMVNNGHSINQMLSSRRAQYRDLQTMLLPNDSEDLTHDISALQNRFKSESSFANDQALSEYFSNILDIGIQTDRMILSSANSDKADLWVKAQTIFEHNDKVTEALILEPSKVFDNYGPENGDVDRKILNLLCQVSRSKRAFSVPPYSLTELERENGMDPARSAEAIPIDRNNDPEYISQNLSGPMWLCCAGWRDQARGNNLISSIIAQALAVCARSSNELVDANSIAASRSIFKFFCKQERPKLQRSSRSSYRPALAIKLEDRSLKQWFSEYGIPFETVLADCLSRSVKNPASSHPTSPHPTSPHHASPHPASPHSGSPHKRNGSAVSAGGGVEESGSLEIPEIDLVRIRSMIIFNPVSEATQIFDENLTKRWLGTLSYFQEWFNLKDYVRGSELNKSTSATTIYLITEKIPNLIAQKLIQLSTLNPLLTKIIGYSLPAGLSILSRTLEHRYDPTPFLEDHTERMFSLRRRRGEVEERGDDGLMRAPVAERGASLERREQNEVSERSSIRQFFDRSEDETGGRLTEERGQPALPPPPPRQQSTSPPRLPPTSPPRQYTRSSSLPEDFAVGMMGQTPMLLDRVQRLRSASSISRSLEARRSSPPPLTDAPDQKAPSPLAPPLRQNASVQVDDEEIRTLSESQRSPPNLDHDLTERLVQVLEDIKHQYEQLDPIIRNLAAQQNNESNLSRRSSAGGKELRPAPFTCYSGATSVSSPRRLTPDFDQRSPPPRRAEIPPSRSSSRLEPKPQIYYELAGEPIVVRRQ